MRTIINSKGCWHNIYTDDEIALIKLVWIALHLAMPWHTYFYPRYTYSSQYGWLN